MAEPPRPHAPTPPSMGQGRPGTKKPYSKPRFHVEKVFETTALACGKISSTQAQCRLNRKLS
jgi:hypothetical protein